MQPEKWLHKQLFYMKRFLTILSLLFALQMQAQVSKVNLQASGLTCAMCSRAVYTALSKVPFVDKVTANIEQSSYDLSFKPGSQVDYDALSKAVEDAGFSVAHLKVTARFANVKVQNDAHVLVNNQDFHFINVPEQVLNGERTISLVDKEFVSAKDFRKYEKLTALKCYQSGMMDGKRVYHVTM